MQTTLPASEIMEGLNEQSTAAPIRSRVPGLTSRHQPTFSDRLNRELERGTERKNTEIRVVDFRSGEAVIRHPDLREMLLDGWAIESAVPHMAETEEVKLLVRLTR